MDASRYAHVKLLAADFLSLAVSSSAPPTISRRGRPIYRAEFVGVVVSRDRRPKLLRFLIDDGSGCVPCVLWLNHDLLSKSSVFASGDDLAASAARDHAGKVNLGVLVRVRGRVTVFRGELQITVKDVLVERDPNAEILHWLQCIKLARDCYDLPLAAVTKV
ncbi:CST complex subunit STN1 [Dendrobium catenatum]|uniref:CST complex subunit STN1 n=1 Tax=Dendrobium catenatum TaxID=906689 RepID=A0A2I0WG55_9ASPA|nr:CST complex subunit STN1 [Dendrobium catenatum]PKU74647.1 CST complex subunit STN1 [Dendrobium catenatum]